LTNRWYGDIGFGDIGAGETKRRQVWLSSIVLSSRTRSSGYTTRRRNPDTLRQYGGVSWRS